MAFEGKPNGTERAADTETRGATGRRCFVILPWPAGDDAAARVDFEAVYNELIRPVAEDLNLDCLRADRVSRSGLIHKEMIENLLEADVVIADVTLGSPDVYFELGIRQTARRAGTVILRHAGSAVPFSIAGMRALDYDLEGRAGIARQQVIEDCRALLRTHIRNSLDNPSTDSLVHTLMPGLGVALPDRPLPERRYLSYRIGAAGPKAPKTIDLVTGDIAGIDDVDVWVNPENTRMEFGRFHDESVSAAIRYLGSRRDRHGFVRDDVIARQLARRTGRHQQRSGVEPATILATPPGRLARTNRVRLLLHAAAYQGEPGRGYRLIGNYRRCVAHALAATDAHNRSLGVRLRPKSALRSVLIPLFGTRSPGDSPHERAFGLVQTAHQYLVNWPDSKIDRVVFLCHTQADLDLAQAALYRLGLKLISGPRPGKT
ncbi:macro domain-containing protein [Hyphomonas sp.]|uniref:macro domain-containing protein n=1 Tax=Hyphomonas sp. TaxID=87 RepID=UPI003919978D